MFDKLYEKIKRFIKENYKEIIFLAILLFLVNYKLNYSIMVSGGTININDRVKIDNETISKGSFNLSYVTELNGTIPTVLLSYVIPSWTKVDLNDYKTSTKETAEDIEMRSKVYLEHSIQSAVKVAYDKANKSFNYDDYKFYVVDVDEKAETGLKVGDILLKVNGKVINTMNEYRNEVQTHNYGDTLNLVVERGQTEKKVDVKVKNIDGQKLTGITILELYDYYTDPKIDIEFKKSESGPSGGLMLALSIYDKLTNYDLTNGLKIVGTGTIDFDGNVGEIDGIEYKLKGAVKSKADVFIAPTGKNYQDAVKLKKKKNYKIKIIEAKTFDQVLEELKNINN